jgi:hypothetical protein
VTCAGVPAGDFCVLIYITGDCARPTAVVKPNAGRRKPVSSFSGPRGITWWYSQMSRGPGLALSMPIYRSLIASNGHVQRLGGLYGSRMGTSASRAKFARWLRVPISRVGEVDVSLIGVDPAAQTTLPGGPVPKYVPRRVDPELREAIGAALAGRGEWLVVVVGAPKVGKSRTLFEALRRYDAVAPLQLVAPVDANALRELVGPGQAMLTANDPAVLWLDDIEVFFNEGVTFNTLREWRSGGTGRIVAATYGARGSEVVAGTAIGGLATIAADVLQHARLISLARTSNDELEPLRHLIPQAEFDAVRQDGLGAYLVDGPLLQRTLATGRHHPGEARCPEGVALVQAAIDWARCGRTDEISAYTLRRLWTAYLPAGTDSSEDHWKIAVKWALLPLAGTIALLRHGQDGFRAYDYVVQLGGGPPPHDLVWAEAIGTASASQALDVGAIAYKNARLVDALEGFTHAAESSVGELAAIAGLNLRIVLKTLGLPVDAADAYRQVIERYGNELPHASERALG